MMKEVTIVSEENMRPEIRALIEAQTMEGEDIDRGALAYPKRPSAPMEASSVPYRYVSRLDLEAAR